MDNKEPKTEQAPVSPEGPGLVEAQPSTGLQSTSQVTSNDENKTKPNQDPGRVADGKKLADSRRVREERRRKEVQSNPSRHHRCRITTRTIIILNHSNSFSSKCRSLTGLSVL